MIDDGQEEMLDVLGRDVVAPLEQRPGARHALEREAAADGGAYATPSSSRVARTSDDPASTRVDVDVLDRVPQRSTRQVDTAAAVSGCRSTCSSLIAELVLLARVAERGLQEEAVELRLGQRERPLLLDRVLGGEQEERVGQRPSWPRRR